MRKVVALSIRRQVNEYVSRKGLSTANLKRLYRQMKRVYKDTPRPQRKNFSIYQ